LDFGLEKVSLLGSLYGVKSKHRTSNANTCCFRAAKKPLQPGFSLVELLVVIAIIALLMSIIMPSLEKARSAAMRVKCAHNLKQANLAIHMYIESNEDVYPCAQDPHPDPPLGYWLWMGRWRSFVEPYLSTKITEDNPSVMLCPQDVANTSSNESFSYAYSMTFYHSPEQIDTMNSVFETYFNPQKSIPQRSTDVAKPAGKILVGEWYSNHVPEPNDQGWWSWVGRRNYLFADGHVNYLKVDKIRPARDQLPDGNLTIHGIKGIDSSP
jgi:prepilin-type N-terminal cleavage/methylation domain-containing protein/prepilin-type processing-associated H-X9-DG protein